MKWLNKGVSMICILFCSVISKILYLIACGYISAISIQVDLPGAKSSAIVSRDIRLEMNVSLERVQHIIKKSDSADAEASNANDNAQDESQDTVQHVVDKADVAMVRPLKVQLDMLAESENQNNLNKAVELVPEQATQVDNSISSVDPVRSENQLSGKPAEEIIEIISDSDDDVKYTDSTSCVVYPRFPTIEISDSDSPERISSNDSLQNDSLDAGNVDTVLATIREPTIEIPEVIHDDIDIVPCDGQIAVKTEYSSGAINCVQEDDVKSEITENGLKINQAIDENVDVEEFYTGIPGKDQETDKEEICSEESMDLSGQPKNLQVTSLPLLNNGIGIHQDVLDIKEGSSNINNDSIQDENKDELSQDQEKIELSQDIEKDESSQDKKKGESSQDKETYQASHYKEDDLSQDKKKDESLQDKEINVGQELNTIDPIHEASVATENGILKGETAVSGKDSGADQRFTEEDNVICNEIPAEAEDTCNTSNETSMKSDSQIIVTSDQEMPITEEIAKRQHLIEGTSSPNIDTEWEQLESVQPSEPCEQTDKENAGYTHRCKHTHRDRQNVADQVKISATEKAEIPKARPIRKVKPSTESIESQVSQKSDSTKFLPTAVLKSKFDVISHLRAYLYLL